MNFGNLLKGSKRGMVYICMRYPFSVSNIGRCLYLCSETSFLISYNEPSRMSGFIYTLMVLIYYRMKPVIRNRYCTFDFFDKPLFPIQFDQLPNILFIILFVT